MITSMTGFARSEVHDSFGQLTCELRSVNHRYLEPGFRLPEDLRGLEHELRQQLGRKLRRGKIDCTVHLRVAHEAERELLIDEAALERVLGRLRQIGSVAPAAHTVDLVDVLRWPGVIRDDAPDTESLAGACRALFARALDELVASRTREGAHLRELLEQRCTALEGIVTAVRARLPEVQSRVRRRLEERLAELAATLEPGRLEQEVVLTLQRLDVAEELDRLDGHIAEIRRVIGGTEAAGRRLDFLMQELAREANTLSSKSQDLDQTRLAVDMKVVVEQMREQVQNIE
jgi:uncharacterized protein (TIGR00255 family)